MPGHDAPEVAADRVRAREAALERERRIIRARSEDRRNKGPVAGFFFCLEGIGWVASIPLLLGAAYLAVNGNLVFLVSWIVYVVVLYLVTIFAPSLR